MARKLLCVSAMRKVFIGLILGLTSLLDPIGARAEGDLAERLELAQRYEHGEGIAADPKQALELYCQAAKGGSAEAAYRIGWMLFMGRGIEHDSQTAARWFAVAAAKGQPQAAAVIDRFHLTVDAQSADCGERPVLAATMKIVAPNEIVKLVNAMAPRYGLDPKLVLAVIQAESAFQSNAVSAKNAIGLMQVLPETGERFGISNLLDVKENLTAGMRYLRWLLSHFRGDITLTLAAYNAGENRVATYNGVPPFAETQNYIRRIRSVYVAERHPFDPLVAANQPQS
jgi:soluble lytic murein transglycosylase-like protein